MNPVIQDIPAAGTDLVGVYDETGEGDAETILFLSRPTEKQITELLGEE